MRWLAFWFRSVFCRHVWKTEETAYAVYREGGRLVRDSHRVSATCGTCGWHRSYWKW